MNLAIRKLGYSSSPWRLVDLDGPADYTGPDQVVVKVRFHHPVIGPTVIEQAVCGETKEECIAATLALLGSFIELRRKEIEANKESQEDCQQTDR